MQTGLSVFTLIMGVLLSLFSSAITTKPSDFRRMITSIGSFSFDHGTDTSAPSAVFEISFRGGAAV